MTGTFVTIEGIDGAGKTTAINCLSDLFDSTAFFTASPTDTWVGHQVRRAISNDGPRSTPVTTLFLFLADMAYHTEKIITPMLDEYDIVISNRYFDSTLAYQPDDIAPHVDDHRSFLESVAEPWYREPDLTIYIDISVDTAMERMSGTETFENRERQERTKAEYDRLRDVHRERFVTVDGEQPAAGMCRDVAEIVREVREGADAS